MHIFLLEMDKYKKPIIFVPHIDNRVTNKCLVRTTTNHSNFWKTPVNLIQEIININGNTARFCNSKICSRFLL